MMKNELSLLLLIALIVFIPLNVNAESVDLEKTAEEIFELNEEPEEGFYEKCLNIIKNGIDIQIVEEYIRSFLKNQTDRLKSKLSYIPVFLMPCLFMAFAPNERKLTYEAISCASKLIYYSSAIGIVCESIDKISVLFGGFVSIIEKLLPVSVSVLNIFREIKTAGMMSPFLGLLSSGVTELMCKFILPVISLAFAVVFADAVKKDKKLTGLADVTFSTLSWILGLSSVIYIGISASLGLMNKKLDKLYIRTARFTIDKSVPIIGNMISDSIESFIACGDVIKNAFGIASVISFSVPFFNTAVELILNMLVLRTAEFLRGLFINDSDSMKRIIKLHSLLSSALVAVYIMAFISIAVFMGVII